MTRPRLPWAVVCGVLTWLVIVGVVVLRCAGIPLH